MTGTNEDLLWIAKHLHDMINEILNESKDKYYLASLNDQLKKWIDNKDK